MGLSYNNIKYGICIALFMLFILSWFCNYSEIKAFWWVYVSVIAFVAIYTQTKSLMECIIGALILDTIISGIILTIERKLFDAFFIILHHLLWIFAYVYLIDLSQTQMKTALFGQLCISSLDILMSIKYLIPAFKKEKLNIIGAQLNNYGRLLLGNAAILYSGVNYYPIILIFNSCVGGVLAYSNDIAEYY